jgi:glycerol-3-phosphate dehydrogenase
MDRVPYIGRFDDAIIMGLAVFLTIKLSPQDVKNEHLGIDPLPKRPEDDNPSSVVDGSSRNVDEDE